MKIDMTIRRSMRGALAAVALVGVSGCTDMAGYDLDYAWGYIPALATLRGSVAYDPQDMPRLPAEHSIPVAHPQGDVPPPFTQLQLDSVGATLVNPFGGDLEPVVLARGEMMYERQCAVCHGPVGEGTGPIVGPGKYPFAPAITIPATAQRSDGYLYAVITAGRGLMPPYGYKMSHEDRWAIVSYIRHLQAGTAPGGPVPVVGPDPAVAPVGAAVDTAGLEDQTF